MKFFKLDDTYTVNCEFKKTRMAFKHVAVITENGRPVYETKICYQNRTWERYEFESVIHRAIRSHFKKAAPVEDYIKAANAIGNGIEEARFQPLKAICTLGSILCETADGKAKWNKRMLSTVPGLDFPDEFDQLPAEERERRLNNAVKVL